MSRGSVDFARTVIWQSETRLELNLSGYNLSDGQVGEWEKWAYLQHKRALRWTRGRVIAASCDFSKCQLTDYGISVVIDVLLKLDVCVERLKLHQNRLKKADHIVRFLLHSQKVVPLLELHLSHNDICDKEASNLLSTFRRTRSSVWLRLEKNLILDPWKMVENAQKDCPGLVISHAKRCTKISKAHVVLFSGLFGTNPGPIIIRPRSPPHLTKIAPASELKSGSCPAGPSKPKSDHIVVAPTLNKAGPPSSAGSGVGDERLHVAPVSVKVPSPSACVKAPPPSNNNVKSPPPGRPASGIRIQKPWDNIKATPPVDNNRPAARVVLKPASACSDSKRGQQQQQELNAKLAHSLGPPTQSGGYPQTVVTSHTPQSAAVLAACQQANQLAAIAYANQIAYATANYVPVNATPLPLGATSQGIPTAASQQEPFSQAHLSQIIASHAQEKAAERAAVPSATIEAAARVEEIRKTVAAAERQAQAAASILIPTAQASKKVAPVDSKATTMGNRIPPPPPQEQRPPSPPRSHGPISFAFKNKNPSSGAPVESATAGSKSSPDTRLDRNPTATANPNAAASTGSRSTNTRWDQAARRNDEKHGGNSSNTGTSKYDSAASRTKSARGEGERREGEKDRDQNPSSSEARRIVPTSKSAMPFSKARTIAQQRQVAAESSSTQPSNSNNPKNPKNELMTSSSSVHHEGGKKKDGGEVMSTTSSRPHRAVLTMIPQKNTKNTNNTSTNSPMKKREGEREREGGSSSGVPTSTTGDGRVRLYPNNTTSGDKPPLNLKPNNNAPSSQPTTPIQVSKSKSLQVSKSSGRPMGEGEKEISSASASGSATLAKAKAPRPSSDCPPRGWSKQSSSSSVLTASSPKRKPKIPVPPKELTPAPKKGGLIHSPERGRQGPSVVSREKSTSVVLTKNLPPSKAMHPVSKSKAAMVLNNKSSAAAEREKGRGAKRERNGTRVETSDGGSYSEKTEEEIREEREKRERSEETVRAASQDDDEEARVKAEATDDEEEEWEGEKGKEDREEDENSLVDEFDVEMRRRLAAMMGTTDPADGNQPEDEHTARQSSLVSSHALVKRQRRPRSRTQSLSSSPGARDRDINNNKNNNRASNTRGRSRSSTRRGASSLDQFYAERNEKKNSPERERNQGPRMRTKSPPHRDRGSRGGRDPWRRPRSRENHRRSDSKRQRR